MTDDKQVRHVIEGGDGLPPGKYPVTQTDVFKNGDKVIVTARVNHFQRGIDDGKLAGPGSAPVIDLTIGDEHSRRAYLRGFAVAQRWHEEGRGYHDRTQAEIEAWSEESFTRSRTRRNPRKRSLFWTEYSPVNIVVWFAVAICALSVIFGIYALVVWLT